MTTPINEQDLAERVAALEARISERTSTAVVLAIIGSAIAAFSSLFALLAQ